MVQKKWQIGDQLKLLGIAGALLYHFLVIASLSGETKQRVSSIESRLERREPLVERFIQSEQKLNMLFSLCCTREELGKRQGREFREGTARPN